MNKSLWKLVGWWLRRVGNDTMWREIWSAHLTNKSDEAS